MSKLQSICNKLIQEATNSPIQYRLAACVIQNGKIMSGPKCNTARNYCRGVLCGSLHAEARAIVSCFGKSISFDPKNGWCFKPGKRAKSKKV